MQLHVAIIVHLSLRIAGINCLLKEQGKTQSHILIRLILSARI
jgi:hypothetical protein